MATLTVNIENKKTERAVKVVLDFFGFNYNVEPGAKPSQKLLNKEEQKVYKTKL